MWEAIGDLYDVQRAEDSDNISTIFEIVDVALILCGRALVGPLSTLYQVPGMYCTSYMVLWYQVPGSEGTRYQVPGTGTVVKRKLKLSQRLSMKNR